MINNDFILNLNINLEEKQHEQEVYQNILARTKVDYLAMREKLACKYRDGYIGSI